MSRRRGDDFDIRVLDGTRETLSYRVAHGEQGLRLDSFLARRLSWRSRTSAQRLLDAGDVELSGRSARKNRRVSVGDIVTVRLPRPLRDEALGPRGAPDDELPRLHEDELLIAIDKPAGMPVHPAGRLLHHTVITTLHRQYRDFSDPGFDVVPKLCHRLDLETSGVLLVAKTDAALTFVQAQFERRTVTKEYLVLVHGVPAQDEGLVDLPIGPDGSGNVTRRTIRHDIGQPSRTRWRVLRRYAAHALLHIDLLTGRHHQIRVHMAALGFPVVGDKLYGCDPELFARFQARATTAHDDAELALPRQALHSHALGFRHPTLGPLRIVSPWPADLEDFCAGLPGGVDVAPTGPCP